MFVGRYTYIHMGTYIYMYMYIDLTLFDLQPTEFCSCCLLSLNLILVFYRLQENNVFLTAFYTNRSFVLLLIYILYSPFIEA